MQDQIRVGPIKQWSNAVKMNSNAYPPPAVTGPPSHLSSPLSSSERPISIADADLQYRSEKEGNVSTSSESKGQVAALIVTFNRKDLLYKCLEACLAQTEPPDHIFLLDNGSSDGTKELLQAAGFLKDLRISYFSFRENIGPAAAFDQLIRLAWMSNFDWMWVMDDDVIATKSALQELKAAFYENFTALEEIGLMASVNVSADGLANNVPEIDMRRPPGQEPIWGELLSRGLIRIRCSTLSSVLIPRSTVARFGSVNPVFWASGLDTDFTLRVSKTAPIYLVGKSVVRHLRNVSGSYTILKETDPARIRSFFYCYRHMFYIRRKYYSLVKAISFTAKAMIDSVHALASKEYPLLRARTVLLGTLSGFVFRPSLKPMGPPCFPMEQDITPDQSGSLALPLRSKSGQGRTSGDSEHLLGEVIDEAADGIPEAAKRFIPRQHFPRRD